MTWKFLQDVENVSYLNVLFNYSWKKFPLALLILDLQEILGPSKCKNILKVNTLVGEDLDQYSENILMDVKGGN